MRGLDGEHQTISSEYFDMQTHQVYTSILNYGKVVVDTLYRYLELGAQYYVPAQEQVLFSV